MRCLQETKGARLHFQQRLAADGRAVTDEQKFITATVIVIASSAKFSRNMALPTTSTVRAEPRTTSYVCSKLCFWKIAVLVSGCAAFALYASSELYLSPDVKTFVLAAYIISWAISLLIFFARITGQ